MKLIAKHSYGLTLLLIAISTITNIVSESESLRSTVSIVVFVLVVIILLIGRKVDKTEK